MASGSPVFYLSSVNRKEDQQHWSWEHVNFFLFFSLSLSLVRSGFLSSSHSWTVGSSKRMNEILKWGFGEKKRRWGGGREERNCMNGKKRVTSKNRFLMIKTLFLPFLTSIVLFHWHPTWLSFKSQQIFREIRWEKRGSWEKKIRRNSLHFILKVQEERSFEKISGANQNQKCMIIITKRWLHLLTRKKEERQEEMWLLLVTSCSQNCCFFLPSSYHLVTLTTTWRKGGTGILRFG